eukprot:CAMPEP_0197043954 /NCGR_PEP_ID=MMETSP1384-20130603/20124_1 /TAXON_ID=29189 /ORGANISM="Ammonia sp." /LENGTH=313 /DNA_ID=CAMNT_0042475331 /DNA_START=6 /DNA_END=947 /DNA_ORIENTATION=+
MGNAKQSASKPQIIEQPPSKSIFWLDCTQSECIQKDNRGNVKQWLSVDKKYKLQPATRLHRLRSQIRPQPPYFVHADQQNSFFKPPFAGIQCDYTHTFTISPPLSSAQTIVSYHSFNQLLEHSEIFSTNQDRGTWCNFYLFGSSNFSHYPFHTNGNVNKQHRANIIDNGPAAVGTLFSGHAHQSFQNGRVSVDGASFVDIKRASHWTHSGIAILETEKVMTGLQINQIGAERQCHHYSGILHEVIVYDRLLQEHEKQAVLLYFVEKYHGDALRALYASLSKNFELNRELIRLLLSFVMPHGLLLFLDSDKYNV